MKTRRQKSLKLFNFKFSTYKKTVWLQQFNVCGYGECIFLSLYKHEFSLAQVTALFIFNSKSCSTHTKTK